MSKNAVAAAESLSDHDLLARLISLAGREREALAELLAHLAALDERPSAYAARGYGSLHAYCTQALRFSEDAASNRIEAARACRRFPVILDLLASGAVTLTSVRILGRHLTPVNYTTVLEQAKGATLKQIDLIVAALAPQPDAPSLVRKLPTPTMSAPTNPAAEPSPTARAAPALRTVPPPIVRPTAPERYRVQFTIGEATHERLRRLQTLLRREIPSGDPGAIFDRAVTLLLAHVENKKLGITPRPRSRPPIRRATDDGDVRSPPTPDMATSAMPDIRTPPPLSPYVPRWVQRVVWERDGGHCAFVSPEGRRCTQREYLDFHHLLARAKGGRATVENISLRCWRHNQYEAEVVFGPRHVSRMREDRPGRKRGGRETAGREQAGPEPASVPRAP